jgi:hypothetical protein
LQRKCACDGSARAEGDCEECKKNTGTLQRKATSVSRQRAHSAPPIVHEVLGSAGQPLDAATRSFFEPRFGHDFGRVRVHTDEKAAESAQAVRAMAYTVGKHIVFGGGQYAPSAMTGRELIAHELTHTLQQASDSPAPLGTLHVDESTEAEQNADRGAQAALANRAMEIPTRSGIALHRRAAPYIKKVTVHLNPLQTADLAWEGTPPTDAPGADNFNVSTGKGYSDPGDAAGTCTRDCCGDPDKQCAPPWNRPGQVGACCTYFGDNFWTGTPLDEHNTWKWWTPIQPYYSSRGIALHQHPVVTGHPIGHGCVRMDEPNAKRIHDFSNGRLTNVTIDGRAAPVACDKDRMCGAPASPGDQHGELEPPSNGERVAASHQEPVPGLEGEMS